MGNGLKRAIRARMAETGERYTAARAAILKFRERTASGATVAPEDCEAIQRAPDVYYMTLSEAGRRRVCGRRYDGDGNVIFEPEDPCSKD